MQRPARAVGQWMRLQRRLASAGVPQGPTPLCPERTRDVVDRVKSVRADEPIMCRLYMAFAVVGFFGCWRIIFSAVAEAASNPYYGMEDEEED